MFHCLFFVNIPVPPSKVEDGAVGVCTQSLTEAEAIVYGGGCFDVFVSNQVRVL